MKYTLKQWRMLRGMTRKELAEAIGKSETTIWHWEKGHSERRPSEVEALRKALDLKKSDVIILP